MNKKRSYISFYYIDAALSDRKKKYLTIAFETNTKLYKKVRAMGTTKLKRLIGLRSYKEISESAAEDNRTISNYVKHVLKKHLKIEE